jgi:hypothetical protein
MRTKRSKWYGMSHTDKMQDKKFKRTFGKPEGRMSMSYKLAKHIRTSKYWSRKDWCGDEGRVARCNAFGVRP